MACVLFGIKNDSDCSGFGVPIPSADDNVIDPVHCLSTYIVKTSHVYNTYC